MKILYFIPLPILSLPPRPLQAQEDHDGHATDTTQRNHANHNKHKHIRDDSTGVPHNHTTAHNMSHASPLNLPMSRNTYRSYGRYTIADKVYLSVSPNLMNVSPSRR